MSKLQSTRRDFLKGAGAAAAAAGAGALVPRRASAARELRMLTWDGYVDPRLLDGFTDEFGVDVKYELHFSDPDSVNKLRAGETKIWDIINLNNPWAREIMWPQNLIVELPRDQFEPYFEKMLPMFKPPYKWAMSLDMEHLLGICQRIGTWEYSINTDAVDWREAQKAGWNMFLDPDFKDHYAILAYDNWNISHMLMSAGVHPFVKHSEEDFAKFETTCRQLFNNAKFISEDFVEINFALLNGEIDASFGGGVYSVSAARLEGQWNLMHVTPESGPAEGKGGINWIEVNSAVNNPDFHPNTFDWLEYILKPEQSYIVATAGGTLLPVGQMADPEVLAKFTADELKAIQWEDPNGFDYRIAHAVEYDVNPDYDAMLDIYLDAKRTRDTT